MWFGLRRLRQGAGFMSAAFDINLKDVFFGGSVLLRRLDLCRLWRGGLASKALGFGVYRVSRVSRVLWCFYRVEKGFRV